MHRSLVSTFCGHFVVDLVVDDVDIDINYTFPVANQLMNIIYLAMGSHMCGMRFQKET